MVKNVEEKDFSLRLAMLRIKKNVSAREMSLAIGKNPNYINHIEIGKTTASLAGILNICDYFDIIPSEFFDIGNPNPEKLHAIIEDLKKLNDKQLNAIAILIEDIKKR